MIVDSGTEGLSGGTQLVLPSGTARYMSGTANAIHLAAGCYEKSFPYLAGIFNCFYYFICVCKWATTLSKTSARSAQLSACCLLLPGDSILIQVYA